jgi:hypothetical protein
MGEYIPKSLMNPDGSRPKPAPPYVRPGGSIASMLGATAPPPAQNYQSGSIDASGAFWPNPTPDVPIGSVDVTEPPFPGLGVQPPPAAPASIQSPNPALLKALQDDPNRQRTIDELKTSSNLREYANPIPGGDEMARKRMRDHQTLLTQNRGVQHIADLSLGGYAVKDADGNVSQVTQHTWADEGKVPTRSQSDWEDEAANRQVAQSQREYWRSQANLNADRDSQLENLRVADEMAARQRHIVELNDATQFVIDHPGMPQSKDTIDAVMAMNRSDKTKKSLHMLSEALRVGLIKPEDYDRGFKELQLIIAAGQDKSVTFTNKPDVPGFGYPGS